MDDYRCAPVPSAAKERPRHDRFRRLSHFGQNGSLALAGFQVPSIHLSRQLSEEEGRPMRLEITAVPPGEAPLWVREHWVGLLLPLAQRKNSPISFFTSGVLSGPKGFMSCLLALLTGKFERLSGFVVEVRPAIEALETRAPEAANWWRENTPHLLRGKQYFVFHGSVGRVIET